MRCINCGSTDVGFHISWRPGLASVVGLISFFISLSGIPVGANAGGLHDVSYYRCKACGSRKVWDSTTTEVSSSMGDDGSSCFSCCLGLVVLFVVLLILVSLWANS